MSRTLKLILWAAIAEMALVALAVFAWRHGALALPGLPAPGPDLHFQPLIYFLPPWIAFAAIYGARKLASDRPRMSDSHRRFFEGMLRAIAAMSIALQGLFAYIEVTGATMDLDLIRRGVMVFVGLWFASLGNVQGKLDPPSGERAPAPGVWTRTSLRLGWTVVIMGLALALCALTLPLPVLRPVLIVIMVIGLAIITMQALASRHSNGAA